MERYKIIATVHICIIHNNKILLSKRKNTGYSDGMYSIIGGHVEPNETLVEALLRETREEIGVNIKPDEVSLIHVMHRRKEKETDQDRIEFYFKTNNNCEYYYNNETFKCEELLFVDLNDQKLNIVPYIRSLMNNIQDGQKYSEFGW